MMIKFYNLSYTMGKADETDFTPEEVDKFNDALVSLVESFGFEICGSLSPSVAADENIAKVGRTLKDLYLAIRYHNRFENPTETYVQWDKYEAEVIEAIREIDPTFAQERNTQC